MLSNRKKKKPKKPKRMRQKNVDVGDTSPAIIEPSHNAKNMMDQKDLTAGFKKPKRHRPPVARKTNLADLVPELKPNPSVTQGFKNSKTSNITSKTTKNVPADNKVVTKLKSRNRPPVARKVNLSDLVPTATTSRDLVRNEKKILKPSLPKRNSRNRAPVAQKIKLTDLVPEAQKKPDLEALIPQAALKPDTKNNTNLLGKRNTARSENGSVSSKKSKGRKTLGNFFNLGRKSKDRSTYSANEEVELKATLTQKKPRKPKKPKRARKGKNTPVDEKTSLAKEKMAPVSTVEYEIVKKSKTSHGALTKQKKATSHGAVPRKRNTVQKEQKSASPQVTIPAEPVVKVEKKFNIPGSGNVNNSATGVKKTRHGAVPKKYRKTNNNPSSFNSNAFKPKIQPDTVVVKSKQPSGFDSDILKPNVLPTRPDERPLTESILKPSLAKNPEVVKTSNKSGQQKTKPKIDIPPVHQIRTIKNLSEENSTKVDKPGTTEKRKTNKRKLPKRLTKKLQPTKRNTAKQEDNLQVVEAATLTKIASKENNPVRTDNKITEPVTTKIVKQRTKPKSKKIRLPKRMTKTMFGTKKRNTDLKEDSEVKADTEIKPNLEVAKEYSQPVASVSVENEVISKTPTPSTMERAIPPVDVLRPIPEVTVEDKIKSKKTLERKIIRTKPRLPENEVISKTPTPSTMDRAIPPVDVLRPIPEVTVEDKIKSKKTLGRKKNRTKPKLPKRSKKNLATSIPEEVKNMKFETEEQQPLPPVPRKVNSKKMVEQDLPPSPRKIKTMKRETNSTAPKIKPKSARSSRAPNSSENSSTKDMKAEFQGNSKFRNSFWTQQSTKPRDKKVRESLAILQGKNKLKSMNFLNNRKSLKNKNLDNVKGLYQQKNSKFRQSFWLRKGSKQPKEIKRQPMKRLNSNLKMFAGVLENTLNKKPEENEKELQDVGQLDVDQNLFGDGDGLDDTGKVDYTKFKKMHKMRLPEGAIRQAMMRVNMDEKDVEFFFENIHNNASVLELKDPAAEETIEAKNGQDMSGSVKIIEKAGNTDYKKYVTMIKNKLPEMLVIQTMERDGLSEDNKQFFLANIEQVHLILPPNERNPSLHLADQRGEWDYTKYKKLAKLKVPEPAIKRAMNGDGLNQENIEFFFANIEQLHLIKSAEEEDEDVIQPTKPALPGFLSDIQGMKAGNNLKKKKSVPKLKKQEKSSATLPGSGNNLMAELKKRMNKNTLKKKSDII